jgi:hypothetical protein
MHLRMRNGSYCTSAHVTCTLHAQLSLHTIVLYGPKLHKCACFATRNLQKMQKCTCLTGANQYCAFAPLKPARIMRNSACVMALLHTNALACAQMLREYTRIACADKSCGQCTCFAGVHQYCSSVRASHACTKHFSGHYVTKNCFFVSRSRA